MAFEKTGPTLTHYLHSQSVSLQHILLRCHVDEGQADAEIVEGLTGVGTEGLYILSWRDEARQ